MADQKIKEPKAKRQMKPRPLFVVFQVLDESGQPEKFDKERIRIVTVSRNAAELLDAIEGGAYQHALYKKVLTGA